MLMPTKRPAPEAELISRVRAWLNLLDDTDGEYGVFVTVRDHRIFEYQRSTARGARQVFSSWRELTASDQTVVEYPQVSEASRMLDDGVIS